MKQLALIITNFIAFLSSFGQTTPHSIYTPGYFQSSKTNFQLVDTPSLWRYRLDSLYKGGLSDSVKPISRIIFARQKRVLYVLEEESDTSSFIPYIGFEIFYLSDSSFCFKESTSAKYLSSCVPPDVGGDLLIVGNFIFLNRSVCIRCGTGLNGVDLCRPLLNYVFDQIDIQHVSTIKDIVRQFPIKEWKVKVHGK